MLILSIVVSLVHDHISYAVNLLSCLNICFNIIIIIALIREIIFENHLVSACFSFQKDKHLDFVQVEQISNADGLIGSSSSRQVFFKELKRDVQISESIDRAKEEKKAEEEAEGKAKLASELKEKRGTRLSPEPQIDENHILINVRHLTRGIITRAFRPDCKVSLVY